MDEKIYEQKDIHFHRLIHSLLALTSYPSHIELNNNKNTKNSLIKNITNISVQNLQKILPLQKSQTIIL